jgi:hypothetical protein
LQDTSSGGGQRKWRPDPTVVARELDKLPDLCTAADFTDGVLWTKISTATLALHAAVLPQLGQAGAEGGGDGEGARTADGDFMETVAREYGDDLDTLRQAESLNESGISRLVDALQMGADLFASSPSQDNT